MVSMFEKAIQIKENQEEVEPSNIFLKQQRSPTLRTEGLVRLLIKVDDVNEFLPQKSKPKKTEIYYSILDLNNSGKILEKDQSCIIIGQNEFECHQKYFVNLKTDKDGSTKLICLSKYNSNL